MPRGGDKSLTKSLTYHSPNSGHKKLWPVFSSPDYIAFSQYSNPSSPLVLLLLVKMKTLLPLEITKSAPDAR